MVGAHPEHTPLQPQGTAVVSEGTAGNAGPGLPQTRQTSIPSPAIGEGIEAAAQGCATGVGHRLSLGGTAIRPWWGRAGLARVAAAPPSTCPMGFFERLSRLFRANLNDLVSRAEDPAKILDQSVADMQADLVKLRSAVATAIASQKRIQNQAEQAEAQSRTWYERAELALKKGEEDLAREALSRRKTYQETATALNAQLSTQTTQIDALKKNLMVLEGKIAEARTKKDMLKARAQAAQAQEQLQGAVGGLNTDSSMAAFERMEEKVQAMEARGQAAAELAGSDLESRFQSLEAGGDVDAELAALKASLNPTPVALPDESRKPQLQPAQAAEVDQELEQLKRSIDSL